MAQLSILEFPDPRLRTRAVPVAQVNARIQQLIDDMFETMYAAPGIGLAASQVDVHERVIVMDITDDHSNPRVFINPEITIIDDALGTYDEGCLSVPGFYETVERPSIVEVAALDRDGRPFHRAPRWLDGHLPAARNRPSRGEAVRRLLIAAEATADSQQARQRTKASLLIHGDAAQSCFRRHPGLRCPAS